MQKTCVFIERGTTEWDALWELFRRVAGEKYGTTDLADEDPETGEVWQYMGTWDGEHQFRHRNHPKTGRREYLNFRDDHYSAPKAKARRLYGSYYDELPSDADRGL